MSARETDDPNPYAELPPSVALEDTIAEQPTSDPPDPEGGRNPDRDFVIRHAG